MTGWEFIVCDALEKVYPDADPRPRDPAVGLSTTLGEPVSFQLAFRPTASGDFLDLRPLRLRIEGDAAAHVTAHRVELVPVELPAFHGHDDGYARSVEPLEGAGVDVPAVEVVLCAQTVEKVDRLGSTALELDGDVATHGRR